MSHRLTAVPRYAPLLYDFVAHEATVGIAAICMALLEHGVAVLELPASVQAVICFHSIYALVRLLIRSLEEATDPEPAGARVCSNPCCRPERSAAIRKRRRGKRRRRGR